MKSLRDKKREELLLRRQNPIVEEKNIDVETMHESLERVEGFVKLANK